MNNKITYHKFGRVLLGMVVLFFISTLGISVNFFSKSVEDSLVCMSEDESFVGLFDKTIDHKLNTTIDINITEMKKPSVSSFLLKDLDDLEVSLDTFYKSLVKVYFFQDVVLNYSSFVYKNVKLFLFYSFIKIPSVSL